MLFEKSKSGFTLAETLITLVIIGVVAALTVPNAIIRHQKEETATKLKKAYSTIAQTTYKAIADNGPISTWAVELTQSKEFAEKYLIPYLNVGKVCGYDNTGGCHFQYASLKEPKNFSDYPNNYYKIILQDGTVLMFIAIKTPPAAPFQMSYTSIVVDINGQKKPNVEGKDVFWFTYYIDDDETPLGGENKSGKLLPNGSSNSRESLISQYCNKTSYSGSCAALIMKDGWQIRDDYPW